MTSGDKLAECPPGGRKGIELLDCQPVFRVGAAEVGEFPLETIDHLGIDRIVDAWPNIDIAGVKTNLPRVGWRDYNLSTDKLAPMHMIAKGSRKQTDSVAALAEDLVGLLKYRNPGPLQISRVDGDVLLFGDNLQPVIESADHDRANRTHAGNVLAFPFPPPQSALRRFGYSNRLRQSEANGRVNGNAAVSGFLNRWDTCSRDRDFHNHVGCNAGKFLRLLDDAVRIAIKARIGLDRQSSIPALVRLKRRSQQACSFGGHLAHQLPADFALSRMRIFLNCFPNVILPGSHFLL